MPLRVTAFALYMICGSLFPTVQATERHAVPVSVKRVLIDPVSNSPVVILEGLQEKEVVPIWIGTSEAASIALELEQKKLPRPNSHDLIRSLLSAVDAKLDRITITELRDGTYFAVITIKVRERELHIDSRPSDAIAVALRANAPIYAAPELFKHDTGRVTRPSPTETDALRTTMGIHVQDLTAQLADLLNSPRVSGVLVAHVELDSLASRLGFRRGDVITRVDQRTISNTRELEEVFMSQKGARKINFQIRRKGRPITIVVDLPS